MFRFRRCCCLRCFYCCCCCFVLLCVGLLSNSVCSNVTSSMRVRVATSSRFTKSGVHYITPEQRPPSFSNKCCFITAIYALSCHLFNQSHITHSFCPPPHRFEFIGEVLFQPSNFVWTCITKGLHVVLNTCQRFFLDARHYTNKGYYNYYADWFNNI